MTGFQRATGWTAVALLGFILVGIFRNGLVRVCRWLPPYLGAVLLGDLAILIWPELFFGWAFYLAKETAYGVLKLALAVDLGATMFAAFPGAAATARHASLIALVAIGLVLVAAPPAGVRLDDLAVVLHPRLANGTALLLLVLWFLALWYHVPTHRFHRAILAGLSAYLLVFTIILGYLVKPGARWHPVVSLADSLGYLALLGFWVREAWRPEPLIPADRNLIRRLQPFRE